MPYSSSLLLYCLSLSSLNGTFEQKRKWCLPVLLSWSNKGGMTGQKKSTFTMWFRSKLKIFFYKIKYEFFTIWIWIPALVVSIAGSHPAGPGSIPGAGTNILPSQKIVISKSRQNNAAEVFFFSSALGIYLIFILLKPSGFSFCRVVWTLSFITHGTKCPPLHHHCKGFF